MTPPLFLIDELPAGDELHLGGDEGRHAARVRRVRVGELMIVGDGRGSTVSGPVVGVGIGVDIAITGRRRVPRPDPRVVVVQALPKGERAELAVEVLTELGVDAIVPWSASRSIVVWQGARGDNALERWRRIAAEAAKQSRRAWLPTVEGPATTAGVAARLAGAAGALVLHEDARTSLASVELPAVGEIVVVVGPEGGIAPDELAVFEAAGATAVRLGDTVLRTSTAGAAALSALSLRLGRWSGEPA